MYAQTYAHTYFALTNKHEQYTWNQTIGHGTLFQFNNCTKTLIFYFVIGFALYLHYQLVSSDTSSYHFEHFPIEVHTLF